ncbi:MAG: M24 family metallopeptidase [Caulobacteraceae bacterium]
MNKRLETITSRMKKSGIKQTFITDIKNIYYFTGNHIDFGERLGGLLINDSGSCKFLYNEMFYPKLERREGLEYISWKDGENPYSLLRGFLAKGYKLFLEESCKAIVLFNLKAADSGIEFGSITPLINEQRMIKDGYEIALLKKSSSIVDAVVHEWVNCLEHESSELDTADTIYNLFALNGVRKLAFESIIAFGPNTSDPHHTPSEKCFLQSQIATLDIGGEFEYYCSDITRTVCFREPTAEEEKIYNIVFEAQKRAIEAVKPGVTLSSIDKIARSYISDHGYGEYFIHRTGHGIGLEDHEYPFITSDSDVIIKPNMVLAVEPGIYLPQKFGVRIEDVVVVTENGCEVINHSPKKLSVV